MNELLNMKTFARVADLGSFSSAARELGVRQPTVSRRMAELEQALEVALLVRTTRTVELTEAGRRYLEQVRTVLEQVEVARDAVRSAAAVRGTVRLATATATATRLVVPSLPDFLERHPNIVLSMDLSERHVDLASERVDVAIRVGGPVVATLAGRRLRNVERWFVASRGWVERWGMPAELDDLRAHTGLVYAPSGSHPAGWRIEDRWVRPGRMLTASGGEPLRVLALAGAGVGLFPDWLVDSDVDAGDLVRVLPTVQVPTMPLWIVWPKQRYQRAATRAFIDWAVDTLGQAPSGESASSSRAAPDAW